MEVRTKKNILYCFLEGQTHFGMPEGARMSLALNEPEQVALPSNSNTTSEDAPQVEREKVHFVCKSTNGKS